MTSVDFVFIIIPIVVAMCIALLISLKKLRRECYWVIIPLALIAMTTLFMTS